MIDMKNGIQKSSSPSKTKNFQEFIRDYRERHRDDVSRVAALIGLGLMSALIIQKKAGIDHFIGSFLIIAIILLVFYKDIKRYKPVYFRDYKMLFLLGMLVTGTLLLGRVSEYVLSGLHRGLDFPVGESFIYAIPIPIGAMLVTLIFDFHAAIIFSFAISLLTGIWLNNPIYPVYSFIGSLTAAFSVIRCRRRSAIIKGGVYVSAVNFVTAGIILLLNGQLFSSIAPSAFLFAAVSGISVAAIVSVLLPAIEYSFRHNYGHQPDRAA